MLKFQGGGGINKERLQNLSLKVDLLLEPSEMGPDFRIYRQHELTDLKTQVKK